MTRRVMPARSAMAQPGGVDDLAMKERRNRKKAGKARKVADEGLGLDFVPQIQLRVPVESIRLVWRTPDDSGE